MNIYLEKRKTCLLYRILAAFICFTFIFSSIIPPQRAQAQVMPTSGTILNLPVPGTMVPATDAYQPPIIRGVALNPEDPLNLNFIIDRGDNRLEGKDLENESQKLIKYFLAALTVPEEEMWVNLSPYESDRIIPNTFGDTEMGRDLLAQDYMLKQLTASLMYPEEELGEDFWAKVYDRAYEEYGTTDIPMNTFNKVWIVPEEAEVYEYDANAVVTKSRLKVMLEEDYVALQNNLGVDEFGLNSLSAEDAGITSGISSEVVREIILPEIEWEVNHGKTFANLRQIYNSMILATWYKEALTESFLGQVYIDQNKTEGVDTQDKQINQKIYKQYVEAFNKGVYDYIREDYDPTTELIVPRRYFSGGAAMRTSKKLNVIDIAMLPTSFINRAAAGVSELQLPILEDTETVPDDLTEMDKIDPLASESVPDYLSETDIPVQPLTLSEKFSEFTKSLEGGDIVSASKELGELKGHIDNLQNVERKKVAKSLNKKLNNFKKQLDKLEKINRTIIKKRVRDIKDLNAMPMGIENSEEINYLISKLENFLATGELNLKELEEFKTSYSTSGFKSIREFIANHPRLEKGSKLAVLTVIALSTAVSMGAAATQSESPQEFIKNLINVDTDLNNTAVANLLEIPEIKELGERYLAGELTEKEYESLAETLKNGNPEIQKLIVTIYQTALAQNIDLDEQGSEALQENQSNPLSLFARTENWVSNQLDSDLEAGALTEDSPANIHTLNPQEVRNVMDGLDDIDYEESPDAIKKAIKVVTNYLNLDSTDPTNDKVTQGNIKIAFKILDKIVDQNENNMTPDMKAATSADLISYIQDSQNSADNIISAIKLVSEIGGENNLEELKTFNKDLKNKYEKSVNEGKQLEQELKQLKRNLDNNPYPKGSFARDIDQNTYDNTLESLKVNQDNIKNLDKIIDTMGDVINDITEREGIVDHQKINELKSQETKLQKEIEQSVSEVKQLKEELKQLKQNLDNNPYPKGDFARDIDQNTYDNTKDALEDKEGDLKKQQDQLKVVEKSLKQIEKGNQGDGLLTRGVKAVTGAAKTVVNVISGDDTQESPTAETIEKIRADLQKKALSDLRSNESSVRRAAVNLLSDIGDEEAIKRLDKIANNDTNPVIKIEASTALDNIQERAGEPPSTIATDEVIKQLESKLQQLEEDAPLNPDGTTKTLSDFPHPGGTKANYGDFMEYGRQRAAIDELQSQIDDLKEILASFTTASAGGEAAGGGDGSGGPDDDDKKSKEALKTLPSVSQITSTHIANIENSSDESVKQESLKVLTRAALDGILSEKDIKNVIATIEELPTPDGIIEKEQAYTIKMQTKVLELMQDILNRMDSDNDRQKSLSTVTELSKSDLGIPANSSVNTLGTGQFAGNIENVKDLFVDSFKTAGDSLPELMKMSASPTNTLSNPRIGSSFFSESGVEKFADIPFDLNDSSDRWLLNKVVSFLETNVISSDVDDYFKTNIIKALTALGLPRSIDVISSIDTTDIDLKQDIEKTITTLQQRWGITPPSNIVPETEDQANTKLTERLHQFDNSKVRALTPDIVNDAIKGMDHPDNETKQTAIHIIGDVLGSKIPVPDEVIDKLIASTGTSTPELQVPSFKALFEGALNNKISQENIETVQSMPYDPTSDAQNRDREILIEIYQVKQNITDVQMNNDAPLVQKTAITDLEEKIKKTTGSNIPILRDRLIPEALETLVAQTYNPNVETSVREHAIISVGNLADSTPGITHENFKNYIPEGSNKSIGETLTYLATNDLDEGVQNAAKEALKKIDLVSTAPTVILSPKPVEIPTPTENAEIKAQINEISSIDPTNFTSDDITAVVAGIEHPTKEIQKAAVEKAGDIIENNKKPPQQLVDGFIKNLTDDTGKNNIPIYNELLNAIRQDKVLTDQGDTLRKIANDDNDPRSSVAKNFHDDYLLHQEIFKLSSDSLKDNSFGRTTIIYNLQEFIINSQTLEHLSGIDAIAKLAIDDSNFLVREVAVTVLGSLTDVDRFSNIKDHKPEGVGGTIEDIVKAIATASIESGLTNDEKEAAQDLKTAAQEALVKLQSSTQSAKPTITPGPTETASPTPTPGPSPTPNATPDPTSTDDTANLENFNTKISKINDEMKIFKHKYANKDIPEAEAQQIQILLKEMKNLVKNTIEKGNVTPEMVDQINTTSSTFNIHGVLKVDSHEDYTGTHGEKLNTNLVIYLDNDGYITADKIEIPDPSPTPSATPTSTPIVTPTPTPEGNMQLLANIYANMKPKDAANLMSNMDTETAKKMIPLMPQEKVTKILELMDPLQAENINPQTTPTTEAEIGSKIDDLLESLSKPIDGKKDPKNYGTDKKPMFALSIVGISPDTQSRESVIDELVVLAKNNPEATNQILTKLFDHKYIQSHLDKNNQSLAPLISILERIDPGLKLVEDKIQTLINSPNLDVSTAGNIFLLSQTLEVKGIYEEFKNVLSAIDRSDTNSLKNDIEALLREVFQFFYDDNQDKKDLRIEKNVQDNIVKIGNLLKDMAKQNPEQLTSAKAYDIIDNADYLTLDDKNRIKAQISTGQGYYAIVYLLLVGVVGSISGAILIQRKKSFNKKLAAIHDAIVKDKHYLTAITLFNDEKFKGRKRRQVIQHIQTIADNQNNQFERTVQSLAQSILQEIQSGGDDNDLKKIVVKTPSNTSTDGGESEEKTAVDLISRGETQITEVLNLVSTSKWTNEKATWIRSSAALLRKLRNNFEKQLTLLNPTDAKKAKIMLMSQLKTLSKYSNLQWTKENFKNEKKFLESVVNTYQSSIESSTQFSIHQQQLQTISMLNTLFLFMGRTHELPHSEITLEPKEKIVDGFTGLPPEEVTEVHKDIFSILNDWAVDTVVGKAALKVPGFATKDSVIGIEYNGEAFAIRMKENNKHEGINVVVGGKKFIVPVCPLCQYVAFDADDLAKNMGFEGEDVVGFVSGLLRQTGLNHPNGFGVMLLGERSSQNLISLHKRMFLTGPNKGEPLKVHPITLTTLNEWIQSYPETKVLTDTGYLDKDYSAENPYKLKHQKDYVVEIGTKTVAFSQDYLQKLHKKIGKNIEKIQTKNSGFLYIKFKNNKNIPVFTSDKEGQITLPNFIALREPWRTNLHPETELFDSAMINIKNAPQEGGINLNMAAAQFKRVKDQNGGVAPLLSNQELLNLNIPGLIPKLRSLTPFIIPPGLPALIGPTGWLNTVPGDSTDTTIPDQFSALGPMEKRQRLILVSPKQSFVTHVIG